MTLIDSWYQPGFSGEGEVRWGLVQCDDCATPAWPIGTPENLRGRGWRFDDFDSGPHHCPRTDEDAGRPVDGPGPAGRPALPNVLVIGALKCGTSSLHRYLGLHPEIQMSRRKELNFFQSPECLDALGAYAAHFDESARVRGEASPIYSCHPVVRGVPERIRAAVPEMRLLYLVRDPVERFVSHYLQNRAGGRERRSVDAAVGENGSRPSPYMLAGMYATQLEQYLNVFPSDQLLVVDQADLRERRHETLRRVFGFLGVDADFVSSGFAERYHTTERKREATATGTLLRGSRLADTVRLLPPRQRRAIFKPAKRVLSRKLETPTLSQEAERRLREALQEEVGRLREMTGQEFDSWRV